MATSDSRGSFSIFALCSVLLFLTLFSSAQCQIPWKYCPDTSSEKISLNNVTVTPYPIRRGQPANFYFGGVGKWIGFQTYARLDITNSLSGQKIYSQDVLKSTAVEYGQPYSYTFDYTFPNYLPVGSYNILTNMLDVHSGVIICVQIAVNF